VLVGQRALLALKTPLIAVRPKMRTQRGLEAEQLPANFAWNTSGQVADVLTPIMIVECPLQNVPFVAQFTLERPLVGVDGFVILLVHLRMEPTATSESAKHGIVARMTAFMF
jgi:hypothetical protein